MQIVTQVALNESDIKEAILAHIAAKGISTSGSASVELVHGDSLSAKVDISSDAGATAATKPINQKAEDADREAMKTELDALGIEYAPRARTATLQDLLETARASSGTEEGTSPVFGDQAVETEPETTGQDTGSMFGGDTEQEKEDPPFETTKEPETETASGENGENSEDDRPLFGA